MRRKLIPAMLMSVVSFSVVASMAPAAQQDKYSLKSPNGVEYSDFKGYEDWQDVAVSETDNDIKAIVANPIMIAAYKSGIPGNGKPFPDGSKIVKIEWKHKANPVSPYAVQIPDTLDAVAFIEKDSKRFPDTSGWGYTQLNYGPASNTFKPYGTNATFGKDTCYACHTIVKNQDYIFTVYHLR
jgi:hypothetical protein